MPFNNGIHLLHECFLLFHEGSTLVSRFVKQILKMVYRTQRNVERSLCNLTFATPHLVVDGFHMVRKAVDLLKTEHAAIPLEGVHNAEDPLHNIGIGRIILKF